MSYFDEMISKTKSVAEVFGKRSAEAIEISKKRIELIDVQNKLSKAYVSLGKIQYDFINGKEPDSSSVEKLVGEISQYIETERQLKAQIEEFKDETKAFMQF